MNPFKFFSLSAWILLLSLTTLSSAQEIGAVRFLGHLVPPQGGSYVSGCWGWTDTTSGREYALLGSYCGTSIVEITNTSSLVEREFIPNVCSSWKEIQTYENYAYVVSEGGGGVQIIDLSYLPDSAHVVTNFIYTSGSKNTVRAHTIQIRDGYMYLNGCANWSPGGILIFSLANPVSPTFVGEWAGNYIHDCYVRNDTIYGAAIYGQGLQIINATNKAHPQLLHTISYSGAGTHNATTTTDGRYVLTTDEIGTTAKTLKIWDITSPPSFPKVAEYVGSPTAIVHNVFMKGNLAIMSYYTAGIRIIDVTDPENPSEVGGYDTYSGDPTDYDGAWSTYPYFPSGKIIIGDMSSGMYVVDIDLSGPKSPTAFTAYSDYQTPTSIQLTWNDPTQYRSGLPLSNYKVHIYRNGVFATEVDSGVGSYLDNSLTNHQYYTYSVTVVSGPDSSTIVTAGAYAGGHATPNSPTSFSAVDNSEGVLLSWVNPSRQMDNTPLNDLASIIIYRDGIAVDSISQTAADTGQTRAYLDSVSGYHSYYIQARDNETPYHYSTVTSGSTAYGKVGSSLTESFEGSITEYQHTGTWDVCPIAASGIRSLTDSPAGNYSNNSNSYFVMSPVKLNDKPMLRFKHAALVAYGDFAFVEISKDERQTYSSLKVYNITMHSQWQNGTFEDNDWITEQIDLSAYANKTVYVRFRLTTNGTNVNDGWFIDDFYLGPAEYATTVSLTPQSEWNLISVPVKVADNSVGTLFPTATSHAFSYSGGYVDNDSLTPGKGYWLKFDSAQTINIAGNTMFRDTLTVGSKWNLIGSIYGTLTTSQITSIPTGIVQSSFYRFDGSYQTTTSIEPGKAYWVKTSQAGKLVFSAFTKNDLSPETAFLEAQHLNSLIIKDQTGNQQTLYFGTTANNRQQLLERSELPPVPPSGAFDARFQSQRSIELASGTNHQTFSIDIQSLKQPVTVEWKVNATSGTKWSLEDSKGVTSLTGNGKMTTTKERISLHYDGTSSTSVPMEFGLKQNYPNPFNPTTSISFSLTEPEQVTLKIYNILGEEVLTLINEHMEPGSYSKLVDASTLSSGMYTYRLTAGNKSDIKKMTVLK